MLPVFFEYGLRQALRSKLEIRNKTDKMKTHKPNSHFFTSIFFQISCLVLVSNLFNILSLILLKNVFLLLHFPTTIGNLKIM